MAKTDKKFMYLAIEKAKKGMDQGQTPFGACIVKEGQVISCAHNIVWKSMDITAHAEIHAIRLACKRLKTIKLKGCVIYSTCEPCPMCFSACHWADLSTIVYGSTIKDARDAGFHELPISNQRMKNSGKSEVSLIKNFLREENKELFRLWKQKRDRKVY